MESKTALISRLKKIDERAGILRALLYRYKELVDPFPYRKYMQKKKCIFVHIPKTAGTAFLKVLGHSGPRDHSTYREFLKSNPVRFEGYFKFTFVRHPYSRFLSTYNYLKSGGNNAGRDLFYKNLINSDDLSVNDFVDYIVENQFYQTDPLFWPQCVYVCGPLDEIMVDFVGKYESIENDFVTLASRLSLENELEKVNVSDNGAGDALSEESQRKLALVYRKDFIIFDYGESDNV